MNIYTFYYYNTPLFSESLKRCEYTVVASRFFVAFKSFCNFVKLSSFDYFVPISDYLVTTKKSVHHRIFPAKYYVTLELLGNF